MKGLTDKEEAKVVLAYLAVCVLWGSTYLGIRIGVSEFPPELFASIRNLTAGALMMAYARLKGLEFPDNLTDVRRLSVVGLFLLFGSMGLISWAEQWVHSGVTSLLVASTPLFMAIIEMILPGGSSLGLKGWAGLLIGFGGVALLVLSGSGAGAVDISGGLIILTASLSWSVGSVYSKRFKATGSIVTHIGIQMLAGGSALGVAGLLLGEASRVSFTAKSLGAMVYLILFGSIAGYSCYIYILQKWPAAKAGTYSYVNPPVAVLLGALVLGEPVSANILVSIVIILGGVSLVQLAKTPPELKAEGRAVRGE